jgi:hypothetical protein
VANAQHGWEMTTRAYAGPLRIRVDAHTTGVIAIAWGGDGEGSYLEHDEALHLAELILKAANYGNVHEDIPTLPRG